MAKPRKYTRYVYQKSPTTNQDRIIVKDIKDITVESVQSWKDRLRGLGITDEQIEAFVKVRSLEAFLDYCRVENIETAYIGAERVRQGKD